MMTNNKLSIKLEGNQIELVETKFTIYEGTEMDIIKKVLTIELDELMSITRYILLKLKQQEEHNK